MPFTCSYDKVYFCLHRGDCVANPGKPQQQRVFDGMGGPVIDPQHEGWTELMVFPDSYREEAVILELERSMLPALVAAMAQVNQPVIDPDTGETEPLPADYRYTAQYIDWDILEPYVVAQCPDFKRLIYEKGAQIPVLKVPFFPMDALKDSTTIDVNRDPSLRPEVGALLPGNYTVGVAGAYPTFGGAAGAYAANNAGGAMAGNVTMTEISNIVETGQALATQALGGFTWLTTSNNPPYGDPTAGWQIQVNFSAAAMFQLQQDNNGTMEIEYLRMQWIGAFNGANIFINAPLNTIVTPAGIQYDFIHDNLFDGNGELGNISLYLDQNQYYPRVYNNVGWDCNAACYNYNLGGNGLIENNAAYDNRVGFNFLNTVNTTARNNTAYDNDNADYANTANVIGRYNRSSDGTAADVNWAGGSLGNTINAVVLNDVQGVNDAVANFFDILAGGPLDGAGEVNAIAARAVCIRNRAVPGPNGTSVGPAEIVTPEPTPTPTTRNPSTTQSHVAMPAAIAMY
jgi:hypothetical protein